MKVRKFSLLPLALLFAMLIPAAAQDVIILRNGDEIQSLVSEVGIDVIKYHRFDNPSGPVYSIEKNRVFMIKYANGTRDVFGETETPVVATPSITPSLAPADNGPHYLIYQGGIKMDGRALNDTEVRTLFATHPLPLKYYNQGQSFKILGGICQWSVIGTGIVTALIMRPLDDLAAKNEVAKKGLITMGGFVAGWITFGVIGHSRSSKAVETYNGEISKPETLNFQLFMNGNEVGLAMKF
ncbi:MAG: hypothetical protein ACOYXB_14845 [Bacteroidota bacterium]